MNRNQTILAAGGAVSALLVAGAGFLAWRGATAASEAESAMEKSRREYRSLAAEAISPTQENLDVCLDNLNETSNRVAKLSRVLFRGDVPLDRKTTPGNFVSRECSGTIAALVADAPLNAAEVPVVDPDMQFGFETYSARQGGFLPKPDQVPRLLRQLRLVDKLVRILYAAGIDHLDAVGRVQFDVGAGGGESGARPARPPRNRDRSRGPGGSVPKTIPVPVPSFAEDPAVPMSCERFGFVFSTREKGLLAVLDAIAAMQPFAMVSDLSFAKTGEDVLPPVSAGEGDRGESKPPEQPGILEKPAPRTARLVSGPLFETPVQVTMFVDVFSPGVAGNAPAGSGGGEGEED